jgi:hypothetical protein
MAGNALGLATVKRALTRADVVIQSLGVAAGLEAILKPTQFFSKATRVLVTAMEELKSWAARLTPLRHRGRRSGRGGRDRKASIYRGYQRGKTAALGNASESPKSPNVR